MSDIKQEKLINRYPIQVSLDGTEKIVSQMKNSICKIYRNKDLVGTGFFCKIPFKNNLLPVLITNNHIINAKDINYNDTFELSINKLIIK